MEIEVVKFVEDQRVGVLAVAMEDGSVHGATVHFAHVKDPLTFVFLISPKSKKAEPLLLAESPASFVIGTDEGTMKTMQIDGMAQITESAELRSAYFAKFPDKLEKFPDGILIALTPSWWRFTDMKHPDGRKVLSSEDAR